MSSAKVRVIGQGQGHTLAGGLVCRRWKGNLILQNEFKSDNIKWQCVD